MNSCDNEIGGFLFNGKLSWTNVHQKQINIEYIISGKNINQCKNLIKLKILCSQEKPIENIDDKIDESIENSIKQKLIFILPKVMVWKKDIKL